MRGDGDRTDDRFMNGDSFASDSSSYDMELNLPKTVDKNLENEQDEFQLRT